MHIADATLLFAPRSGGVRRYLRCKQDYLKSIPTMRHTLVVPGPVDRQTPGLVEIASPRIPFAGGYRLPLRPSVWRDQLCRIAPDLIEAGDPYHPAWSVLAAVQRLGIPSVAFVHSNLSRMLASRFGTWAGHAAERYLRSLYDGFDVILAASATVARDLSAAGISRVEVQRLGVDADTFHPAKRDDDLRFLLGLPANTRLLAFAGRLAREKYSRPLEFFLSAKFSRDSGA